MEIQNARQMGLIIGLVYLFSFAIIFSLKVFPIQIGIFLLVLIGIIIAIKYFKQDLEF